MSVLEVQRHLARLMPAWETAGVAGVEYLSGGYSNANYAFDYRGKRYVLRIPLRAQPFVDRGHEQSWYAQLPAGVGIKPVALDAHSGCMLSAWVHGELLIDAWPRLTMSDLTAYLHRLHGALPDAGRRYDLRELTRMYWHDDAPPHTPGAPAAADLLTCHNDLNPWNILVTDEGWVTLDWEFVGRNDPLFDVVSLYLGLELAPQGLLDFAAAYLNQNADAVVERLRTAQRAFWIRELGWARFQLRAGNDRQEIRSQLETAGDALAELEAGGA